MNVTASHCGNETRRKADVTIVGWKCTLQSDAQVMYIIYSLLLILPLSFSITQPFFQQPYLSRFFFFFDFSLRYFALVHCLLVCLLVTLRFWASIKAFNFSEAWCFQDFSEFTLLSPQHKNISKHIHRVHNVITSLKWSKNYFKGLFASGSCD